MNDYVDWDAAYLEDDVLGMSKAEWREKLEADTQTFIANGGEIEYLPYDWTAEIAARIGYWKNLGQEDLDDMLEASDDTHVY